MEENTLNEATVETAVELGLLPEEFEKSSRYWVARPTLQR